MNLMTHSYLTNIIVKLSKTELIKVIQFKITPYQEFLLSGEPVTDNGMFDRPDRSMSPDILF